MQYVAKFLQEMMLAVRMKNKKAGGGVEVGSIPPSYGALSKNGKSDEAMQLTASDEATATEQSEKQHWPRPPRLQSTGTLQRLMLVAQALEGHRLSTMKDDLASSRIILGIRSSNMVSRCEYLCH